MSTIVERFLTDEFRVARPGPGKYLKGRYKAGPIETVMIYGSLQPLSGRALKLVTEGTRFKQAYRFFSDKSPVAQDLTSLANSDRITINGEAYRVIEVLPWVNFDLEYFKSILARDPEQESDAP